MVYEKWKALGGVRIMIEPWWQSDYMFNLLMLSPLEVVEELFLYLATLTTVVNVTLIRVSYDGNNTPCISSAKHWLKPKCDTQSLKNRLSTPDCGPKAPNVLPSSHHQYVFNIPNMGYPSQAWRRKQTTQVGLRVERIWHSVKFHTANKGQVPADFLTKLSEIVDWDHVEDMWTLETNNSSHKVRGGGGIILQSPDGIRIVMAVRFIFSISNNKVEYEAVLFGLRTVRALSISKVTLRWDF